MNKRVYSNSSKGGVFKPSLSISSFAGLTRSLTYAVGALGQAKREQIKKPYKTLGLSIGKKKTGGRNNQGRITAYHRGGGNKLRYIYLNTPSSTQNQRLGCRKQVNFPLTSAVTSCKQSLTSVKSLVNGEVRYIVRDPNRTAWIAGIYWSSFSQVNAEGLPNLSVDRVSAASSANREVRSGEINLQLSTAVKNFWYSYYSNVIAPEGLNLGDKITQKSTARGSVVPESSVLNSKLTLFDSQESSVGNQAYLKDLMVGTIIYNLAGKYMRAAGCSGIIISKTVDHKRSLSQNADGLSLSNPDLTKVTVKLQSGQYKIFSGESLASIGIISNGEHKTREFRKAGQKRWLGRRPIVRGVAMNPIDHPHGGGEGKSSGGRPSVTPWGKPTKGKPTRSPKKPKLNVLLNKD
jgi:ribosomal protein L2